MVQGRRPDLHRRNEIARLRQQGWTLQAIGARFGVTRQAIGFLIQGSKRGIVHCVYCKASISTTEGSAKVRGAACLECLAARPDVPFAQVLLSLRMAAGVTQEDLGRRTGLSAATISSLERGEHKPQKRTRERLLRYLRCR